MWENEFCPSEFCQKKAVKQGIYLLDTECPINSDDHLHEFLHRLIAMYPRSVAIDDLYIREHGMEILSTEFTGGIPDVFQDLGSLFSDLLEHCGFASGIV